LITQDNPLPEGYNVESRIDSRGIPKLNSAFVIAAGRTLKSGKLNVPINVYFIPQRSGFRYGLSFGFNAKSRYVQ